MPTMAMPLPPPPPIIFANAGGEHFYFNNNTNINVLPGFHRGMLPRKEEPQHSGGPIFLPEKIVPPPPPLPPRIILNCWNVNDCNPELLISPDGLTLYKRGLNECLLLYGIEIDSIVKI
jgi:hypothetical protein